MGKAELLRLEERKMSVKLIYWPHSRMITTKEDLLAASQLVMHPWPASWPLPMSEEEAEAKAREMNELARKPCLYTAEQFEKLEEKPDLKNCYEFALDRHSIFDVMPNFQGFTPRFAFHDAGFKEEAEIDFLEDFSEYVEPGSTSGFISMKVGDKGGLTKVIRGENIEKARRLAGTSKAYELNRLRVEQVFNRLNADGIDFVVFRDYRNFPAVWDNVHFYSRGDFVI